ncbi:hypothetical protein GN316_17475 [Xylophilus sp. Kf1]|nr:hypothetical protein [Xylophilus sp. Kf1]
MPVLVLVAVMLGAWVFPPDTFAQAQTQVGLDRAVTTFATARALHAALSVAQGTQIAVEPGGVGAVFAPGQALKPVTELVEQFSTLMLAACIALGVQLLMLKIGAHVAVSVAVSLAVAAWVLLRLRPGADLRAGAARRLLPVLVLLLLVRFSVPLMAMGNEAIFRLFLQDEYTQARDRIALPDNAAAAARPTDRPGGFMDSMKDLLERGRSTVEQARNGVQQMQQFAGRAVDHLLRLLAVFVLQVLVLPLLFFWGLWRALKALTGPAFAPRAVA